MKKPLRSLLLLLATAALIASCQHRPLEDPANAHYIRVYIDEEIKNVTYGFYNETYDRLEYVRPRTIRVVLADPVSGTLVSERYLQNQGTDEEGYYIDGYINAPAGTYNLLLYTFGAPQTQIRNEWNYYTMQAYTNPVNEYYLKYLPSVRQGIDEQHIVRQPEHLFHDVVEKIVVRNSWGLDTLRNAAGHYFRAHSMVKSYYIQTRVKGIEWATSAVSVLSGMAGSSLLHKHYGMIESDPAHVFFAMTPAERTRNTSDGSTSAVLYATFNTFGKLPEEPNSLTLTFEFMRRDGSTQTEKIDITDMFDTPMVRDQQWILIDHEIELPPPDGTPIGSGGMTPGVDDWVDIEADIPL